MDRGDYGKLKKSITISILDFKLLQGQKYHSVYTLKDQEDEELAMVKRLVTQVCRKLRKGKDTETIAGELEEDIAESRLICEAAENFSPGYDEKKVFAKLMEKKR